MRSHDPNRKSETYIDTLLMPLSIKSSVNISRSNIQQMIDDRSLSIYGKAEDDTQQRPGQMRDTRLDSKRLHSQSPRHNFIMPVGKADFHEINLGNQYNQLASFQMNKTAAKGNYPYMSTKIQGNSNGRSQQNPLRNWVARGAPSMTIDGQRQHYKLQPSKNSQLASEYCAEDANLNIVDIRSSKTKIKDSFTTLSEGKLAAYSSAQTTILKDDKLNHQPQGSFPLDPFRSSSQDQVIQHLHPQAID